MTFSIQVIHHSILKMTIINRKTYISWMRQEKKNQLLTHTTANVDITDPANNEASHNQLDNSSSFGLNNILE